MSQIPVEHEIIAAWRSDIPQPVVSICCITYNHAAYIEAALHGFLMQRTDFPFEILVHDDASTDETAEIVRHYADRYPMLVKPVLQSENQYAKGHKVNFEFNFPRVKGEFIAICEGDDYWTDPLKLQKQVDFLRAHPQYVLCAHWTEVIDQDGHGFLPARFMGMLLPPDFALKHVLSSMSFHTNSCVFRRLDLPDYARINPNYEALLRAPGADDPLMWIVLSKGGGHCLQACMSKYRLHAGGVWSPMSAPRKGLARLQIRLLALHFVPARHWPRLAWIISRDAAELLLFCTITCVRKRSLHPLAEVWQAHRKKRTTSTLALILACGGGLLALPWKLMQAGISVYFR